LSSVFVTYYLKNTAEEAFINTRDSFVVR